MHPTYTSFVSYLGLLAVTTSALFAVGCGSSYSTMYDPAYAPPPAPLQADAEHNTEAYDRIKDNPFVHVADDPRSTFSADVDTASYSNVRRFLNGGELPPPDAVRTEELINYFSYDYPNPEGDTPFSVTTEVGECPWNTKHQLVHIGLKGRPIDKSNIPARNLTFLLDVSGSMASANKLGLVKSALGLLVNELGPQDRVAIVVYAGAAGQVLETTPGDQNDRILAALEQLQAGGSTAGGAGIQLAYNLARQSYVPGGINRVILATDGDFNVGMSSRGDLERLIEKERESGVFLTVLGFGQGNIKDSQMEMLADKGNGNYAYIDSMFEARKVLVKEAGSTLITIAKDVKLQVEFNPQHVEAFRLIGYENRLLRHQDFADDSKDAGEIGAGHTVTALYEIIPAGHNEVVSATAPLKYQTNPKPSPALDGDTRNELLTFKLRYKKPTGDVSQEKTYPLSIDANQADLSDNFRFSASVALFGMLLRDSSHAGAGSWPLVLDLAKGARGQDAEGYRTAFLEMVAAARDLKTSQARR